MNRCTAKLVRLCVVTIVCGWALAPVRLAVAQAVSVGERLSNVAQAIERMADVMDNADLTRDWVAHVDEQLSVIRAERDTLVGLPGDNGPALDTVVDCVAAGEYLRHTLITGSPESRLRSSDLLKRCGSGLQRAGVASRTAWIAPRDPVPMVAAVPAPTPVPVILAEIGTLGEWAAAGDPERLYTAGLWAARLVDAGAVDGDLASLTTHLFFCVDAAVETGTMTAVGPNYAAVEIAILCALLYGNGAGTESSPAAPSSTAPGMPFVCTGGCAVAPDPACNIKGNVNPGAETRIYHTPASPWYDRTDVKPEEGDRWFCSVQEAQAAGFRAPYQ